jgi:hypothetical protein
MENTANEISSNIKLENEENISCQESSKSLENQIDIDDLKNRENKTIKQQNVEKTIQKWIKLQKTIKEEITLEEVIIKQQKDDFNYLKDLFFQYYETKIKSRKQFYIIRKLEKNMKVDNPEFIVEKNGESILLTSNETIKNLLFLIRNNYDYITKIVSLIEETDEPENIDSLVELFCNQFYDNILIPNPEQEELLILIYKLLEEEITPMNSASIDEFLSDTTFIGKFISSYMNKRALKVFLAMLVNPLILSIENSGMECMDMSLKNINREVNKKRNDNQNSEINFDNWLDDIPKSTIHFKKYYVLDNDEENEEKEKNEMKVERSISMRSESIDITSEEIEKNLEYKDELTLDKIYSKIINEKNEDIKELYLYQLEQIGNDPDIFTNAGLKLVLNDPFFKNNRSLILKKYIDNFKFIKEKIDYLIQTLIDRISTIPYTVRCICKVISLLMQKKFPLLPKYLRNSFIGKFIFDKCIFPVLSFENKNVMDLRIFSHNTKRCLNAIISVLSNANRCCLYPTTTDTEKTIFNYYLLEIIPILNQFYEKLIDIELPKTLEDLVTQVKLKIDQNADDKIFKFRRKNIKRKFIPSKTVEEKKIITEKLENEILFDYFKNNNDEIMHLESICFSLQDILFILSLIKKKPKIFEGLPKYNFFNKTIERIQCDDIKFHDIIKKNGKARCFYIIFKDEKNSRLENLLRNNKKSISTFTSVNQDADLICKRIKFCIKTILKGLNLLNNKDYSYLNKATSTKKFFSAIKKTLNDLSEYSEENDQIPLKWYGQYIYNYKKGLAQIYQEDDYKLLYSEIYEEEENILKELKSFSSTIITREGMNLRCAEKLLDRAKYDLADIEEAKKYVKIEKFIDTEKIEVLIKIKEEKDEKDRNLSEKDKLPMIIITDASENSSHLKNPADENDKKNKNPPNAIYIKDFINKFIENPLDQDKNSLNCKIKSLVTQDIISGDRKNGIYKTMEMYMNLVKKRIKEPLINIGLFNDLTNMNELTKKIEDHILRQIYKDVYPPEQLEDIKFYQRTKCLDWVTPEQLEIKKVYFNQLGFAISSIRKIDNARSVLDKIDLIINAHTSINNTIKFSLGKEDDSGQDEMTPILQYIILKAHPKRMYSNINYLKCFLGDSNLSDQNGFLLSQIESAYSYINNLNYQNLKITKEEFDSKFEEARKKYNFKF